MKTGKFYPPVVNTMYIPIGPWPVGASPAETAWIRQIGEMMRQNAYVRVLSLFLSLPRTDITGAIRNSFTRYGQYVGRMVTAKKS